MLLRLFLALNPPPGVREQLALAQTHLRMALGKTLDTQVALRWTRPAQFHLTLLFLQVLDAAPAKAWLRAITPSIATLEEVVSFNRLYSYRRARQGSDPRGLIATWVNIALSCDGLRKLTPEALQELEDCEKRFARLTKEVRAQEPGGSRRSLMADWMHANHAFHDVLYRVAELPYVESVAKAARRTFSGPTVWAPVDDELEALYERNQAEHRAIRQALAAGSVAGARELAREHVMHSFELLTTILAHVSADWART